MARLRDETRAEHAHVEALPFSSALAAGELPLASYIAFLQALRTIYAVFEQAMEQAKHPLLGAVWNDALRKLPWIEQDLAYLQPHPATGLSIAELRAQLVAQRIRYHATNDPIALLGYLYVLEGSTLGGQVLQFQAAQTLGLSRAGGLAYLSSYEKSTKARWTSFSARMNQIGTDVAEQNRMVAVAREAFKGIAEIIEALHPIEAYPPHNPVQTLNPEAGSHAIPSDSRELQAALRAGERSWRHFPYYAWRYSERGERFTRSDSAWLVTLSFHRLEIVEHQIMWLGRLLSSRGMPQWMLELHLAVLYEELITAAPEKQTAYMVLQHAAAILAAMRRRYISDEVLHALSMAFDLHVGHDWSARLPRTGGLLAAAVADEAAGIIQAVNSIEPWMTDPARFPPVWIEAVQLTIQQAREQAGSVQ